MVLRGSMTALATSVTLANCFGPDPPAVEEATSEHRRPEIETFGNQLLAVARTATSSGRELSDCNGHLGRTPFGHHRPPPLRAHARRPPAASAGPCSKSTPDVASARRSFRQGSIHGRNHTPRCRQGARRARARRRQRVLRRLGVRARRGETDPHRRARGSGRRHRETAATGRGRPRRQPGCHAARGDGVVPRPGLDRRGGARRPSGARLGHARPRRAGQRARDRDGGRLRGHYRVPHRAGRARAEERRPAAAGADRAVGRAAARLVPHRVQAGHRPPQRPRRPRDAPARPRASRRQAEPATTRAIPARRTGCTPPRS